MTKEQIKKSGIYSPGLIGGEKVFFLFASTGLYYFKHDAKGTFVKGDDGKYAKLPLDEVIDARQRYLMSHENDEKEEAVKNELKRLQSNLVDKANETIEIIVDFEGWLSEDDKEIKHILANAYSPEQRETKRANAKSFFAEFPNIMETKANLQKMIASKDYESLYHSIQHEMGVPIATFQNGENLDFTAFKNIFGANAIEKTFEDMKKKGMLYLLAKINIEKIYHPERF